MEFRIIIAVPSLCFKFLIYCSEFGALPLSSTIERHCPSFQLWSMCPGLLI